MGKSKMKKGKKKGADSRKKMFIALGIVAIISFGFTIKGIIGSGNSSISSQTPVTAQSTGDVQIVNMKLSAAGYSPNYVRLQKGIPVKIITDATEDAGCVRGFMIPDLGINQALKVGKDEINFTPPKSGQLAFSCQMKMSTGTFEVS